MDTEVDIENPQGVIRPGMYGSASVRLDSRPDVLTVPVQAVAQGVTPTVLVVGMDGKIAERPVRIGLETPNSMEIRSGLQEHELVVIGNRSGLKPGMRAVPKILPASDFEGGE